MPSDAERQQAKGGPQKKRKGWRGRAWRVQVETWQRSVEDVVGSGLPGGTFEEVHRDRRCDCGEQQNEKIK